MVTDKSTRLDLDVIGCSRIKIIQRIYARRVPENRDAPCIDGLDDAMIRGQPNRNRFTGHRRHFFIKDNLQGYIFSTPTDWWDGV